MEYIVKLENWNSVFAVPSSVVDNYIKLATGASLKVLLFMLRNNNQNYDISYIAQALGISAENVEEAFCFWEQVGILCKTDGPDSKFTPLPDVQNKINTVNAPVLLNDIDTAIKHDNTAAVVEKNKKFTQRSSSGYPISPSEISEKLDTSPEIKALFSMAEISLGNLLTYTEQRSLIWIYEYLGLKADVILMLLEYCISIDKRNMHYLETIAISWQENDINTLEAAQAEIKRLQELNSFTSKVLKVLQIERKPTPKQHEFISLWIEKGYSIDLIEYAYEKTIDSIDKCSFPYINRILENWYDNGLITRDKVDEYDLKIPNSKKIKNKPEQSYDLNDLDSLAVNLNKTMNGG
ncbi:MAG: DnaD domain protein [Clostridiales bacterium]|jgi:DnaD/phage-associated family protein|nr:DnaD domain protein [Clostridiales bacterium]